MRDPDQYHCLVWKRQLTLQCSPLQTKSFAYPFLMACIGQLFWVLPISTPLLELWHHCSYDNVMAIYQNLRCHNMICGFAHLCLVTANDGSLQHTSSSTGILSLVDDLSGNQVVSSTLLPMLLMPDRSHCYDSRGDQVQFVRNPI